MKVPFIYIREGDKIVEKEAPVVEKECWWCKNPFMWEVKKPAIFVEEIVYYKCCSCGAKESRAGLLFSAGEGERK